MQREEWEAAFYAYRQAQARVNNASAYMTLVRWTEQVAALRPTLPGGFVIEMTRILAGARRMSRRLAQAWYQYARALDSGYQMGDLEDGVAGGNLDRLRQNFLDRLQEAALLGEQDSMDPNEDVRYFERALRESDYSSEENRNRRSDALDRRQVDRAIQEFLDTWGENREVEIEPFEWREDSRPEDIREWIERTLRETAERESSERRTRLREGEEDPSDEEVQREHEKAGQAVAGEVHGATSDAARKLKEWAYYNDSRVAAVARGTSATPCAFCAMLASRGFAYRGVRSAMTTDGGSGADPVQIGGFRKVHPNCNCFPIIRWINMPRIPLPDLNDEFARLWIETGRRGGFNAFRRALYKRNKELLAKADSQED